MSATPSRLVLPRPRRMSGWVSARLHPPRIGAREAEQVLAPYGCRLLGRPANLPLTWRNRVVAVRTSAGPKVLKEYRETSDLDAIAHEHSIIDHLETRDFPATRLNHTATGSSLVIDGGHRYALFDFEAGRQVASTFLSTAYRRCLLDEAGRTLARLHRELDGFQPAGRHHLGDRSDAASRERDLAWHLATLDRLVDDAPETDDPQVQDDLAWLRGRADQLRRELLDAGGRVQDADLPRMVIHGDYGTHNLLFRRDGTAVVLDFELARFDRRPLDLVIASLRMPPAMQDVFLAAYRDGGVLTRAELAALPWLWRYHLLSGAVRSWQMFRELGGSARLATARSRLVRAEAGPSEVLARWQ